MKTIYLTKGKIALVDDDDYEKLSQFRWCYHNRYAVRAFPGKRGQLLFMHRVILDLDQKDPRRVDHKNGNGLDNQRNNLRFANSSQNSLNSTTPRSRASGWRGVYPQNKAWCGAITIQGKEHRTLQYESPRMAAMALNELARSYGVGEFYRFNRVFASINSHPADYKKNNNRIIGTPFFRGVSFHRPSGKWRSYIIKKYGKGKNYKMISGGYFDNYFAAAAKYNILMIEHYGLDAGPLNKIPIWAID